MTRPDQARFTIQLVMKLEPKTRATIGRTAKRENISVAAAARHYINLGIQKERESKDVTKKD